MRWLMFSGWVVPPLFLFAIALLAPADIIDQAPSLDRFTHVIHDAVLRLWRRLDIFRHADSTAFPQVARVSSAFAMLCWLWMTLVSLIATVPVFMRRPFDRMRFNTKQLLTMVVLFPPLAIFFMWAFFSLSGDPTVAHGLTTNSRLGYAFMGTLAVGLSAFFIGYTPMALALLLFARKGAADG
jgi:hypothetical protein